MSVLEEFDSAADGAYHKLIATKILDQLKRHREETPEASARRWPWELLQNAKDAARPDASVRARISLDEEKKQLDFSHTGRPFTPDDLHYLIVQTSTKDRPSTSEEKPKTTGQFGTGFLTTHLLSTRVALSGEVQSKLGTVSRFALPLDRSGSTPDEVIQGVKRTMEAARKALSAPAQPEPSEGNAFSTTFRYELDDAGIGVAQTGLVDLSTCLPFVLAFNPKITDVEVTHARTTVKVESIERLAEAIDLVRVTTARGGDAESLHLVVVRGEKAEIAVPVEVNEAGLQLKPLHDRVPKLFCDFPLIGSETFPLPVVVNSPWFRPNEPRSEVLLKVATSEDVRVNRSIFLEVVRLYERLVDFAARALWTDLYLLADIGTPPEILKCVDKDWFATAIRQPIRGKLSVSPIVETAAGGRATMESSTGCRFPSDSKAEAREIIWEMVAPWMAPQIPKREHVHVWHRLLWADWLRLDVVQLMMRVSAYSDVSSLAKTLGGSEEDALGWLNTLVSFLKRYDYLKYLNAYQASPWRQSSTGSRYAKPGTFTSPVLPNQRGVFHLKEKLYLDDEIDEGLKDIAALLGKDFRAELLHPAIALIDPGHKTLTAQHVAKEIESRVRERLNNNNRHDGAFRALLRWFDVNPELAQDLFPLYGNQHLLQTAEEAREVRRQAERAHELAREVDQLRTQQEALESENEQLQSELEQLREQVGRLQANGTESNANGHVDGEAARHHAQQLLEVWEAVKKALGEMDTEQSRRAMADLGTWMQERPELFQHIAEASREAYLNWLLMVVRAKEEVKAYLERMPDDRYDVSQWEDDSRFPTIVTGVKYCGRDIVLVIRPADGGFIVLYEEQEKAILEGPDAELWIQGDEFGPQRFNIGKLARFLGVNRIPLKVPATRPAVLYLN